MRRQQFVVVTLLRPKASIGNQQVVPTNCLVATRKLHCWLVDMCTFGSTFVLCAREVLMSVMFSKTLLTVLFADLFEDWWVASVA